jgi:hypothetical protein
MPRKAPDDVREHRITLGTFERALATESLRTSQADVVSRTLVGLAAGAGGVGLLLAAATFAAWKAPGVVNEAAGKAKAAVEDALGINVERDESGRITASVGVGGLAGVGGILDDTFNASSSGMVELRREGQALARERAEIVAEVNAYCSLNGDKADAVKCNAAHARKDAYFAKRADFRRRVAEWSARTGKDDRNVYGGGGDLFGSLGDIDPNYA